MCLSCWVELTSFCEYVISEFLLCLGRTPNCWVKENRIWVYQMDFVVFFGGVGWEMDRREAEILPRFPERPRKFSPMLNISLRLKFLSLSFHSQILSLLHIYKFHIYIFKKPIHTKKKKREVTMWGDGCVSWIYCGNHFTVSEYITSLCRTP